MKKLLLPLLLVSINVFAKPVNINTADAQTIADSLSGVGIKKAEAIVKYRAEKGAFKSADEIKNVSGIGEKTFSVNKADILVADPAPSTATPDAKAAPATPDAKAAPATPAAPAAPAVEKAVKK